MYHLPSYSQSKFLRKKLNCVGNGESESNNWSWKLFFFGLKWFTVKDWRGCVIQDIDLGYSISAYYMQIKKSGNINYLHIVYMQINNYPHIHYMRIKDYPHIHYMRIKDYPHIHYMRIKDYPHIHYMRIKPTIFLSKYYFDQRKWLLATET